MLNCVLWDVLFCYVRGGKSHVITCIHRVGCDILDRTEFELQINCHFTRSVLPYRTVYNVFIVLIHSLH